MKKPEYTKSIATTIKTFLDESNRPYSFDETNGIIKSFSMYDLQIKTIVHVFDLSYSDSLLCYSYFPFEIKDDSKVKTAVAAFLSFVNYGLVPGNFEFRHNDGNLRFKYKVDYSEGKLAKEKIQECIAISSLMIAMYGPGVLNVVYSKADPIEAYQQLKKKNKLNLLNKEMERSSDEATEEYDFDDNDEDELLFEDLYDVEEE